MSRRSHRRGRDRVAGAPEENLRAVPRRHQGVLADRHRLHALSPRSRQVMPRWQRAYTIAMCALIGAAFAYAACEWARWPRLTYFPVTGSWAIARPTAT